MSEALQTAVIVVGGLAIVTLVIMVLAACVVAARADEELAEMYREERLRDS